MQKHVPKDTHETILKLKTLLQRDFGWNYTLNIMTKNEIIAKKDRDISIDPKVLQN